MFTKLINSTDKIGRKMSNQISTETKMATETEEVFKKKCSACDRNHDLETCQLYLAKPVEERSKLLFRKNLCYGYVNTISKDDTRKSCKKRRIWKVRNKKHLTTLHGTKVERKSNGDGASRRANKQNSSIHNTLAVENDKNEEICCNSS